MKRLTLCAVVLSLLAPSGAFAAVPDFLTKSPEDGLQGEGAGQLFLPRGIAADPNLPGDVYVSDGANGRISEFSPWGEFVRAWGWGVDTGLAKFEICTQASGCQKGIEGDGAGQIEEPEGIAVDSEGDVYVAEAKNSRVQKFDSAGNFILMFGLDVNKTKVEGGGTAAERNLCTAASGDVCQAGTPGSGPGQFVASLGSYNNKLAVSPIDKTVFVGEFDGERIQAFNPDGSFEEEIALPAGKSTAALAVDSAGILYIALVGEPEVRKLKPSGPSAEFLTPSFAAERPRALAVSPTGNLYVVVEAINVPPPKVSEPPKVLEFDPSGKCLNCGSAGEGGKAGFDRSTDSELRSIAVGSACGPSDIYVAHIEQNLLPRLSFLKAFGEPPNPTTCPPPARAPEIGAQYATSVGTTGAILGAQISPKFWPDTTYYVQYGTGKCSEGGCDKEQPLAPGAKLTSQTTSQFRATTDVFLSGLAPDTTYHYRFVATSSGGGPVRGVGGEVGFDGAEATFHTYPAPVESKKDCANQAFRTAASATLPDCRAYEMVSPVDKNGGDVAAGRIVGNYGTLAESSLDGGRATFSSLRPFADPKAAPLINQYLSERGTDGWTARSITPPRADPPVYGPGVAGQFKSFDEDLCTTWLMQDSNWPLVSEPAPPDGVTNLYKRHNCSEGGVTADTYELLSPVNPPGFGGGEIDTELYFPVPQGHSAGGTKTAYQADAKLTANACATAGIFQVYLASLGPLRLVSILPPEGSNSGKAICNHASVGNMEGLTDGFREASLRHAVSADGERVFWTDSGDSESIVTNNGPGNDPGKLYLRLNASQAPSKAEGGVCTEAAKACTVAISGSTSGYFWAADPEATQALYTAGSELFQYDVAANTSTLIAKGVSGVIGASEDLSRIYFVSTEKLSGEQQNSEGTQALAGQSNVYLAEGGNVVFVGTLVGDEGNGIDSFGQPSSPANIQPYYRKSRVSPDGMHLAFTSAASLTGYDNTDRASGEPATELFLYDAEVGGGVGELNCVSCNPGNARPAGREIKLPTTVETFYASALLPGWAESLKPTRLLSADGNRLFFESFDALALRDTNGKKDVYQWERGDKASCDQAGADVYSPEAGGCLSLISSGQSAEDSELIDASQGGQDVFFTTASSLLPQDPGLIDVYDARVGGGYPPPPSPQPACEGEACQGPLEAPNDPTPASASFQGAGNVVEKAKKKKHKKHKQQGKKHKKSQKQAKHKRRSA